jgi:hypothetical protein
MDKLPCEDEYCAYFKEDVLKDRDYCSKNKCHIDELTEECKFFETPQTCDLCKNTFIKVYETGGYR